MKTHVSTYGKGMNKDVSVDSIPSDMYLHAEDIRFFTNEGDSISAGVNIKGMSFSFPLSVSSEEVIGSTTVRNKIIFFTADSSNSYGRIYELVIDPLTNAGFPVLIYDHPDMGFSKSFPIEAIGRSEDSCIERVVFSDYNEYTKSINILDSCFKTGAYTSATSYCGIHPTDLDIFQGFIFNTPIVDDVLSGGSLLTGMYQYAFKLVTKDGKETLFSQATPLISVYPEHDTNNIKLNGAIEGTVTGKSVKVDFDLLNINLSNIQYLVPIRVFTNTINGIPEIHQYPEIEIDLAKTNYTFIDSGTNLVSELTNEEYILNNFIFKTNKTFATKDDVLLYGNIKEEVFELNCIDREDFVNIRYKGGLHNGQYILATHPSITADPIEATYVNPYNDESGTIFGDHSAGTPTVWRSAHQFNRKSGGVSLGGSTTSGYLDYKFCLNEMDLIGTTNTDPYDLNDGYTHKSITHDAIGDPLKGNEMRGYKRGEVYRFGIVFFSKDKGQTSYVYPIGDIKFPSISDDAGYDTIFGTGVRNFPICLVNKSYALGIEFELNLPTCVLDQISGYQIVRVERTQSDKIYVNQGIAKIFHGADYDPEIAVLGGTYVDNGLLSTIKDLADTVSNNDRENIMGFFSPEVSYNVNSANYAAGDYLKATGIIQNFASSALVDYSSEINSSHIDSIPFHLYAEHREPIVAAERKSNAGRNRFLLDNTPVRSYSILSTSGGPAALGLAFNDSDDKGSLLGTSIICKLEKTALPPFMYHSTTAAPWGNDDSNPEIFQGGYLIDYCRDLSNQYGGRGYSIMSRNVFHPVSNVIDKITTVTRVYQGDTFIGYYDFATNLYDDGAQAAFGLHNNSLYQTVAIPVETCINLDLTHGATIQKGTGGFDHDNDGTFETKRFKEIGNKNGNMFEYNPVFSQVRKDRSFFAQPLTYGDCGDIIRDVRTYISDPKINGETIDSWSNIRVNNFKDVDSQYGPINRLLNLRDEVYFLQNNGFGKFSINPRNVIAGGDGQPTELGTGQGLTDYGYLSTKYGCKHQWGCVATGAGIYYFDVDHRKIFSYLGNNAPVSDIKGFHGFLNYRLKGDILLDKSQGGDNPILDKGVHCTFDYNKMELSWTFLGTDNAVVRSGFTLVMDELKQVFSHFLKIKPKIYLNNTNHIISPDPTPTGIYSNLYLHEHGPYGSYYGRAPIESMISVVVNTQGDLSKILKSIEFNSTVDTLVEKGSFYDTRVEEFQNTLRDETISSVRIYNEHQDSGKIDLTQTREFKGATVNKHLKRKFDKWRLNIPRNNQLNDSRRSNVGKDRFRSTYFVVELYFQNNNDKEFKINRILSHFDYQMF
jgi:hypothetical protein